MPVFTNLETRIQNAPFNEVEFSRRLPNSQVVASATPLIHVEGRFDNIIASSLQEIPTAESANSQKAEDDLGYQRSVYFFAGRACHRFGSVALAFAPDCEAKHTGSATPFDSGGLVHPNKYIQVKLEPDDELPSRIEYGKASTISLTEWRKVFAQVLAAYFDSDVSYWTDRPARFDPEELYGASNSYEAWSFEVRFYEPQTIHERVAWSTDESMMNQLRPLQDAQPVTIPGDPPSVLDRVFEVSPLDPAGSPTFCATMELWVKSEVGL